MTQSDVSGTLSSGWSWGSIWHLFTGRSSQEVCLFREHQIRLTAAPGGKTIFSLSCKYVPRSYHTHLTSPHPTPASFRPMLIYYLGVALFSSSVPFLFDCLMTNVLMSQTLLSVVYQFLFILTDVFIMIFLISYLGAVLIEASCQLWVVGLLRAGSWAWFICLPRALMWSPAYIISSKRKQKCAVKEI